jgi:hypothetical protein
MSSRVATIVVVCWLASVTWAQPSAPEAPQSAPPTPVEPASTNAVTELPRSEPLVAPPAPEAAAAPSEHATAASAERVATPPPTEPFDAAEVPTRSFLSKFQIHGFASEGGFVSTANEYIGSSSNGSLKFFETGINVSLEPVDQLRVGLQVVFRSVGVVSEDTPRFDWALVDYRLRPWIGLRAGLIKIPLGLYNEYVDIDSARTAILLPQSVYPLRNRDALISHTGFALYGNLSIGAVGALDYQIWLGTLTIPRSALTLTGASLISTDTKYVTGGQVFWRAPLEGLRLGVSYIRASIDFNLVLDDASVNQLVMAGLLPAGHRGDLVVSQSPTGFWVGSAEYIAGDWLFAAEYSRWLKHQETTLPMLVPTIDEDAERFYALATYRLSTYFEVGTYYSVTHADVNDREGESSKFAKPFNAFQRDLAASVRIDVNEYWLWKVEAHFIDGVAELQAAPNPSPKRRWGLFLFRTTVTF